MFFSFSKTIARFGGFRLGLGIRITKKNAVWIALLTMFVAMFQLMWYMLLLCGWMIYAVCYGIYWCIKKIIVASSKKQNNKQTPNTMSKATQNPQTERKEDTPSKIKKYRQWQCLHCSSRPLTVLRILLSLSVAFFNFKRCLKQLIVLKYMLIQIRV